MAVRSVLTALSLTLAPLVGPFETKAAADGNRSAVQYRSGGDFGVHRPGGPEIIVFGRSGFQGRSAVIDGPSDLRGTRLNDRISSVSVRSGRWEVCSDPGFRGRCQVIGGDVAELRRIGLNDTITSLRPVGRHFARGGPAGFRSQRPRSTHHSDHRLYGSPARHARGAPVVLFADPDGRGRSVAIFGPEPHLNPLRFNDITSSIDARSGAWLVCSEPNYRGRCEVISGFAPRTRAFGLNDNISSIRPVDYGGGKRGRRY